MKIGIIVAMEKELEQLLTIVEDMKKESHGGKTYATGRVGNNEVVIQQSGIGKVNAAIGAVEMLNAYTPDILVSTGVAGGADTSLEVGNVVVGNAYCYHDAYCGEECAKGQILGQPARYVCKEQLVDKALSLKCNTKVRSGLIVSGDWFVDSREKMRSILDDFAEAMAVDMESGALAQVCHLYGVPFLSFRIISDTPGAEGHLDQYLNFWDVMADKSFGVTQALLAALTA